MPSIQWAEKMQLIMIAVLLVLFFGLAGCGGTQGVDEAGLDDVPQGVINGTPIFGSDRDAYISNITICNGGSGYVCSGVLLDNYWVLTAAHCNLSCSEQLAPGTAQVSVGGVVRTIARVVDHFSLDLSMVRLSDAVGVPGRKSYMYTHTAESLSGIAASVEGYGVNSCDGSGLGTLRAGTMTASIFPDQYNITWQPVNWQTTGGGDSGGPFFRNFRGLYYQVGVEKSGACGITSYAARPENFERWAFEVMYNAPISVPTTDPLGRGIWNQDAVPAPPPINGQQQFWTRPLLNNMNQWTKDNYYPCSGMGGTYRMAYDVNFEQNYDYLSVDTGSGTFSLTGAGTGVAYGSGMFKLRYTTDGSVQSPGVNWMTIQCGWVSSDPGQLVCHGPRCGTTRDPLQNSWNQTVSWDPCAGGSFTYYIDYDTEYCYDTITVGVNSYCGKGSASAFVAGPTTVSVQTDYSVQSAGIRSLKAVCSGW